jgi:hypothetical protein
MKTKFQNDDGADQGTPKLIKRLALVCATCLTIIACGCGGPKSTVQGFLNAAIRHEDVSRFCGEGITGSSITGYTVRAYSIENVAGDLVSVKITFLGQQGNDIYETHTFRVKSGKIISIE